MIHESVFVADGAVVAGDVTIGANSSIWYNAVVRGDMEPVTIGSGTNIQDLVMIHVDEGYPCVVGDRVGVGHNAILHGCTVEDECLIGMGSVLMNGVYVGTGSVIGAGAVVPERAVIPPNSLVMGVPGRVVREVDADLRARIKGNSHHYAIMAADHRAGKYPPMTP
jgi:carbonic anhydrase/acetyltransferase-like protein (isoleucine patch superfamily)